MSHLDHKPNYRRNLPHIQPDGATLFVTCRLAGSLPGPVIAALQDDVLRLERAMMMTTPEDERAELLAKLKKQAFARYDTALERSETGPTWLRRLDVAAIVIDSLRYFDGERYTLDAFTVMSNHIHVLLTPLSSPTGELVALQRILHSFKRYTAREANGILGRTGQFWHRESYDHVVRDVDELAGIRRYVLNNPVKAGLVDDPQGWPFSWASWWE